MFWFLCEKRATLRNEGSIGECLLTDVIDKYFELDSDEINLSFCRDKTFTVPTLFFFEMYKRVFHMQGAWHFPSTTSTIVLVLDHGGLTLYNITPAEKASPVRHPVKCWETMLVDFLDLLSFLSHKKEAKYVFVVICSIFVCVHFQ